MKVHIKALLALGMVASASGAFAQQAGKSFPKSLAPAGATNPKPGVATRAPAPALSRVTVWAVGSSQYNSWEEGLTNAYITTYDHGGDGMTIAVWEVGYANPSSRIGKMNGTQLPQPFLTESLCGTSTTYPVWCVAGQTITGNMVYYDLSGYQSGSFSGVATSLVFPYNQRNTSINIR